MYLHAQVLLLSTASSSFSSPIATGGPAPDPLKRARTASSSLIPFPRVGRSVGGSGEIASSGGAGGGSAGGGAGSAALYFGQKRTGKSSLIPFPRVGRKRGGPRAWGVDADLPGGRRRRRGRHSRDMKMMMMTMLIVFDCVGRDILATDEILCLFQAFFRSSCTKDGETVALVNVGITRTRFFSSPIPCDSFFYRPTGQFFRPGMLRCVFIIFFLMICRQNPTTSTVGFGF